MPEGLAPSPHGIFLENSTQRLYFNSHSVPNQEELIVAFDIVDQGSFAFPSLLFRYALTSELLPFIPAPAPHDGQYWFTNGAPLRILAYTSIPYGARP